MSERTCIGCGVSIEHKHSNAIRCRKNCGRPSSRKVTAGRSCAQCGRNIDHMRSDARWCSNNCSTKGWYAANVPRPVGRICPVCGDPIADEADAKRIYCTISCQAAATRIRGYGIDLADYFRMEREQGHRCAICGCAEKDSRQGRWCIDHDHVTGAVRGLLCSNCNWLLGHAKDTPDTLRRAAEYIERTKSPQPT